MRSRARGLLVLLLLVACAPLRAPAPLEGPPRDLRILLTNDDGYAAEGLAVLREALRADGHEVVVVAPSENRSGSSASLTTEGRIAVREVEPGVFAVDGTPADCVLLGLERIVAPPVDLVVSGVNFGQNIGSRTVASGTVGAAVTAADLGVPAVAVSQTVDPVDFRRTPRFFPDAAAFGAALVEVLARHEPGAFLPAGVVLNVNHPPAHRDAVRGVRLTRQGRTVLYALHYEPQGDGSFEVGFRPNDVAEPAEDADTTAIAAGYVSISPLQGSWNATRELPALRFLTERLERPEAP